MSLSIPRGPSVVLTASAINWHAFMLLMSWGTPWEESVPSFSRIIPGCFQKKHNSTHVNKIYQRKASPRLKTQVNRWIYLFSASFNQERLIFHLDIGDEQRFPRKLPTIMASDSSTSRTPPLILRAFSTFKMAGEEKCAYLCCAWAFFSSSWVTASEAQEEILRDFYMECIIIHVKNRRNFKTYVAFCRKAGVLIVFIRIILLSSK